MVVAKRPGGEKPAKIEKEGPRTRVRTSGKTNSTRGWLSLHKTGPGREKHKKRSQSSPLSLPCAGALFSSHLWVDMPSHLEDGFSCYYLNKIEL